MKKKSVYNIMKIGISTIPPPPFSKHICPELRYSIYNSNDKIEKFEIMLYLDEIEEFNLISKKEGNIDPFSFKFFSFDYSMKDLEGCHDIILKGKIGNWNGMNKYPISIKSKENRSMELIEGAWVGLYHWSEKEGKLWNEELKKFTEEDWREVIRGMNELGMNIVVIQEVFRNQKYHNRHNMEKEGYKGKSFYPSKLFPRRMNISTKDPIRVILEECDKYNMYVFLGVGLYAWFDFSSGSLIWHKKIMSELWSRYGNHSSLYGWYISAEVQGSLKPSGLNKPFRSRKKKGELINKYREEIILFFKSLREYCNTFAPEKPIMLASNCHNMKDTEGIYAKLFKHLNIICPFGFHRIPRGDISGEHAAAFLQKICDNNQAHLWLDLEVFLFGLNKELYPRPISGLIDDIQRFKNFEKIICYQYPGLFNAPWAKRKPGGIKTVKLYKDYLEYFKSINN